MRKELVRMDGLARERERENERLRQALKEIAYLTGDETEAMQTRRRVEKLACEALGKGGDARRTLRK
jgi:hypothetical protein